jgi:hypothetical protein
MAFRIQIRRDTAIKWQVNNPVLLQGEMGYETDTTYLKIGDGTTNWNDLEYWNGNLSIQTSGSEVVQGAGTLNFTGGVSASATDGVVTLDFSTVNGVTGPTGPAPDITVYDDVTTITGITGIKFEGGGVSVGASGDTAIVTIDSLQSQLYNSTVRYTIKSDTPNVVAGLNANDAITIMSAGNIYFNKNWTRTVNTLRIFSQNHGLSEENGVLIRNTNFSNSYLYAIITNVDTDWFEVYIENSGDTSGSGASYIPAFTLSGFSTSGMTLVQPSVGNSQLISLTVSTTPASSTYFITFDNSSSIANGAGDNSEAYLMNPPVVSAWNLANSQNRNAYITWDANVSTRRFVINNLTNTAIIMRATF